MTAGVRALGAPGPPSAAWVATLLFVGAETMLFGGLAFAFLVYRSWSPVWPPLGEPRLPLAVTAGNTLVLVASAPVLWRAVGRARRAGLALTAALGTVFLAVQGGEWARMIAWGLTAGSGPYGGFVYVLLGVHALHVAAAVLGLAVLATRRMPRPAVLEAWGLYWTFVVGVWALLLFPVVYLG
jgi:heme/copper-type cytochrome/quinol oxidase subunit 3